MITPSISSGIAQFAVQQSTQRTTAGSKALSACTGLLLLLQSDVAIARTTGSHQVARPTPSEISRSGPPEPLIAVISLSNQHIEVYGPAGSIDRSRISSGQPGHDTPPGVFSILQRNRFHRSNIYSNAPMPYMQRLTWSGIALHEGYVPNYRASHGCIRLPGSFARKLWGMGRIGMRVIVSPSQVAPVGFVHASLPVPRLSPSLMAKAPVRVAAAGDEAPTPRSQRLAPYEAAQERLAQATAMKSFTSKAVKPALETATDKSAEARRLSDALQASARILADAEDLVVIESEAMATVQTENAEALVRQRMRMAESGLAAVRDAHDKLKQSEAEASNAAFAAAAMARDAQMAAEAADEELRLARKAVSPLSVFISRKTGQIHIRQGFQEMYQGPVVIAEPDRALGTHVFTAMQQSQDGASLRWTAVSVPTNGGVSITRPGRGFPAPKSASTASEALDRIALPEEARELMSERVWPGASLIVSDFGLGETNQYTDFVILTR